MFNWQSMFMGAILLAASLPCKTASLIAPSTRSLLQDTVGGYACDNCVAKGAQCAGESQPVARCCSAFGNVCVTRDSTYAECRSPFSAVLSVINDGWAGSVLSCGDHIGDDASLKGTTRRALLDITDCLDGDCTLHLEQCGGRGFNVSTPCCDEGNMCVVKDKSYAQCLTADDAGVNVEALGWDGTVLNCEEMPEHVETFMDEYGEFDLDEDNMYSFDRAEEDLGAPVYGRALLQDGGGRFAAQVPAYGGNIEMGLSYASGSMHPGSVYGSDAMQMGPVYGSHQVEMGPVYGSDFELAPVYGGMI